MNDPVEFLGYLALIYGVDPLPKPVAHEYLAACRFKDAETAISVMREWLGISDYFPTPCELAGPVAERVSK